MRIASVFLLFGLALSSASQAKDLDSAVLEGRRVSYLVCELANLSGAVLNGVEMWFVRPDGTFVGNGSPFTCNGLAHGETCAFEHAIAYPQLDFAGYCHVEVDDVHVVGALRLLDRNRNTIAEASLRADVHGKLAELRTNQKALATQIASLLPTLVVAYQDDNSNDVFDAGDGLIAKIVDGDGNGVLSPGDVLLPGRYFGFAGAPDGRFRSGALPCVELTVVVGLVECVVPGDEPVRFVSTAVVDSFSAGKPGVNSRPVELIDVQTNTADDTLFVRTNAPLLADTVVTDSQASTGDADFIDVDLP